MKIIELKNLSVDNCDRIINRGQSNDSEITAKVEKIIKDVKSNGDQALIKYGRKFYGSDYNGLQVSDYEIKEAYQNVDVRLIKALEQMIKNIASVHQAQLKCRKEVTVEPEKGIKVWREFRAIDKVGLYIPGGKASYPSSVLMTAIPAQIAGCREIIICTPPKSDGKIPAVTLVAADMVGVKQIYKSGGAEAIAAMAYGTESVPQVYKIFGAGNAYVMAAKIRVSSSVAIDMPAGPSEVLIIADESANPVLIAADLLADAEHGIDSACVLLTTSKKVAAETTREIERQLLNLDTADRCKASLQNYGLIAVVDSLDEAVDFVNDYAPEHLEIMTKNPLELVPKISNAGSVFMGDYTAKAAGDYATGANHILPTVGFAKSYSPLSVEGFGRWMQVQECDKPGLASIAKTIETMAEAENLPAHGNSASIRFEKFDNN